MSGLKIVPLCWTDKSWCGLIQFNNGSVYSIFLWPGGTQIESLEGSVECEQHMERYGTSI